MKKIILITILSMLFLDNSKAQFSIVAYPPPADFTLEDLWYLDVVLSGSSTFDGYFITLDVFKISSGHIATAKSGIFTMMPGIKKINKINYRTILDPITSNYIDPIIFRKISERGGKFPQGDYTIVLNLFGRTKDITGIILIENLTGPFEYQYSIGFSYPPTLIYPYDRDTIVDDLPTFSWASPFPLTLGDEVTYDITIVEINESQSPYSALKSNPPYFKQTDLSTPVFSYPVSSSSFSDGKTYAWQIVANVGTVERLESEIWIFEYGEGSVPAQKDELEPNLSFAKLQKNLKGSYYLVPDKNLYFKYDEEYHSELLNYRILDYMEHDRKEDCNLAKYNNLNSISDKAYGNNRYRLTCDLNYGFYILEIINDKEEKWYLRFNIFEVVFDGVYQKNQGRSNIY